MPIALIENHSRRNRKQPLKFVINTCKLKCFVIRVLKVDDEYKCLKDCMTECQGAETNVVLKSEHVGTIDRPIRK